MGGQRALYHTNKSDRHLLLYYSQKITFIWPLFIIEEYGSFSTYDFENYSLDYFHIVS